MPLHEAVVTQVELVCTLVSDEGIGLGNIFVLASEHVPVDRRTRLVLVLVESRAVTWLHDCFVRQCALWGNIAHQCADSRIFFFFHFLLKNSSPLRPNILIAAS